MAIYGIKAVKYCLSKNLLHYVEADAGGGQTQDIEVFNPATGQCTVTNPLTVLPCLVGSKATLTVDDAVVNRRHQYTARLTFVTADNPNLDGEYYAFVVETNDGEQMLLGSKVAPRCSVTTRQNVAATAGDINGYTTTVDFKAPYAPLRLPVTTEPVTDTREFDICCGAIKQGEPISGPAYDVCCGEIQGEAEPTLLTVRWLDGDGSLLDSATYYSNQPEPTTSEVPTKASTSYYDYTFDHWQVQSVVGTVKTYEPVFHAIPKQIDIPYTYSGSGGYVSSLVNVTNSHTETAAFQSNITDPPKMIMWFNGRFTGQWYFKFVDTTECTILTADWSEFNAAFPDLHPIYHPTNPSLQIGYYSDEWQGSI